MIIAFDNATAISEVDFNTLLSMASEKRKQRSLKFLRREDTCRSLLAEALLRYGLALNSIVTNFEDVVTNQYGKPVLPDIGLHFNVSHSGGWVVAAFDLHEVGVDVERIHTIDESLSKRFFSQKEHEFLDSITDDSLRLHQFFKIWVLKESYIKSIGKGLSCTLATFSAIPDNSGEVFFESYSSDLPSRYFKLYDLDSGHCCALCLEHDRFLPKATLVTIDEIFRVLGVK